MLWFLGGLGLAAAPGLLTFNGEAAASSAADQNHVHGISLLFVVGGVLTAAAVFRVGMHVFLGWGSEPVTDEAAEVGELPEEIDKRVAWNHVAAPAACLTAAVALSFWPSWHPVFDGAVAQMASQPSYLHTVYTGTAGGAEAFREPSHMGEAALHGLLAAGLAMLLALTSVFHRSIPRWACLGAFAERGWAPMRAWQSGHPGDYVFWLTSGVALFGSLALLLLRR